MMLRVTLGALAILVAIVGGNTFGKPFASNPALAQLAPCVGAPSPWPPPASNQIVTWGYTEQAIAAGSLKAANAIPSPAPSACRAITRPEFVSRVQNNGSCTSQGSTNAQRMPTWQDLVNCRTLTGQVSTPVSGTATGAVPCNTPCMQGGGTPQAATPLDTSTSPTTINPSGTNPVAWSITPSAISGTCTLALLHGSSTVLGPFTLSQGVADNHGPYTGGAGSGYYTLEIKSATNYGSCTVSGSLSWWQ